jgi:hypothetical protein
MFGILANLSGDCAAAKRRTAVCNLGKREMQPWT